MGKAIVYCSTCGKSLLEDDFLKGRAVRAAAQSFCAACSPIDVAALPAHTPGRLRALPTSSTTSLPKVSSTARIPTVASTRRIPAAGTQPSTTALWVVGGAALGFAVLAVIYLFSAPPRPRPASPPPAAERDAAPPPPARPAVVKPSPPAPSPPAPARPAPAMNAVEEQMRQELAALRANRFDHDLQEARRLVESVHAAERAAEIDGMLDALSRVAGPRLPEVVALRLSHEERLARAAPASAAGPRPDPSAPPPDVPPGLEGHWPLDDLSGGRAADLSGHGRHARVHGELRVVPGRLGQAVLFDGTDGFLEVPRGRALDALQEGPYTLSAWFKPSEVPRGPEQLNGAFYGIVIKPGLHVGLSYSHENGGSFEMMHWLRGVRKAGGYTARAFAPGTWHHLAGTADPRAGRTRLYVNGEPLLDVPWPEGDRAAEPGHARKPWRIGIALPKAKEWGWSAKGAVDDVRLYSRILDAAEIRALADGR